MTGAGGPVKDCDTGSDNSDVYAGIDVSAL